MIQIFCDNSSPTSVKLLLKRNEKTRVCSFVQKKTEVRLYPRLARMLKAFLKVWLWPISNGNAVMTYVGFRSKINTRPGVRDEYLSLQASFKV